jgi:hypothetical protein
MQDRIEHGRDSLTMQVSLDVSARDVAQLRRIIESRISSIPVVINGFDSPGTFLHITMRGVSQPRQGPPSNSWKEFRGRRIADIERLYVDMEVYALLNVNEQTGSDFNMQVYQLDLVFVRERAGGCQRRRAQMKKVGDRRYESFKVSNNNCFFKCVAEELGLRKATKVPCNEIRREFGLLANTAISLEDAVRIFEAKAPLFNLKIVNDDGHRIVGPDDAAVEIMYEDDHYLRLMRVDPPMQTCQQCWKKYRKTHICSKPKHPKCKQCGGRHNPTRRCNLKKKSYYQIQICNDPDKRVILDRFKAEPLVLDNIIHFDIESHHKTPNCIHEAYILGAARRIGDDVEYMVFRGVDCISDFLDWALGLEKKVYLNAYNGAGFDHYFLVRELMNRGEAFKDMNVQNGAIVTGEYKNLKLFDLYKHMVGSLKSNLEDWKCTVLKGDFDHDLGNRWELMSEEAQDQCERYLRSDVLGLMELYEKAAIVTHERFATNIYNYISVSQLSYTMWCHEVLSVIRYDNIILPTMHQEKYFRGAVYGGRTYKSKNQFYSMDRDAFVAGELEFDDIQDYILDLDVVSLYPAAMAHFDYPVDFPKFHRDGRAVQERMEVTGICPMGVYEIEYWPDKDLAHPVLPRRENGSLKWDLLDYRGYYTSVDIQNAIEYGYDIKILSGYEFVDQYPIYKKYIEDQFRLKSESPKGTPKYYSAKLTMNGLYGKNIQRPIYNVNKFCKDTNEFWKFYDTHEVLSCKVMNNQYFVVGIPLDEEEQQRKITKPTHLGAFILSYSRKIMLKYMDASNPFFYSSNVRAKIKNDLYYTDTDSIQVHASNQVAQSCELGGITDDLGSDCKILRGIWIAPKLYILEYIERGSRELKYHKRGKGVSSDQLSLAAFEWMNQGKAMDTAREFRIQKIHTNKTGPQQQLEYFSLLHKEWEETRRMLNLNPWQGRDFDGNGSLPHGANWHRGKK